MGTWRELIEAEMERRGECWEDVVAFSPEEINWDKEFDPGFGTSEGEPFTLWTTQRVYFPSVYDGAEEAESVPRNPRDEVTHHIGGQ
ncbi:MAG: hypothetical protein K940chlam3_00100 [Chlamydiae bacterium]|nr:hypothetical protein [Chlamydiota bacterium]